MVCASPCASVQLAKADKLAKHHLSSEPVKQYNKPAAYSMWCCNIKLMLRMILAIIRNRETNGAQGGKQGSKMEQPGAPLW